MYADETFFHLSAAGQLGLAILSIALATITVWLFSKISTRFHLAVKVLLALVFMWLFVWLSPQVYYLYYRFLFEDLPLQWVVQSPPSPWELLLILSFQNEASLANHAKAALFWLMFGMALVQSAVKGHARALGK